MQRWLRLAFWAAIAITFVVATLPKPIELPGQPSDKIQHILAFAFLAALGAAAYARTTAWKLIAALAVFGGLIELTQMVPALHRDAEVLDWIADIAAVIVVLLVVRAWQRFAGRT